MSYFSPDVIAKEQLHGAVGSAVTAPPAPGVYVAPINRGGAVVGRKLSPLSLIITPDGQIMLNLDIQNRERKN